MILLLCNCGIALVNKPLARRRKRRWIKKKKKEKDKKEKEEKEKKRKEKKKNAIDKLSLVIKFNK